MIYPVILAGGAGARLWPVSRRSFPKQFASLMDGPSLFQRTVERVIAPGFAAPTVIAAEDYRFLAQKQVADIQAPLGQLIVEPVARNTAAAILVAALAHKDTPDAVLLILPSDHHVEDERLFLRTVNKAAGVARKGLIAALGVQPAKASTEYGYLKVEGGNDDALVISRYAEKPESRHAEAMVAEGNWLWNTGIYLFRVDTILRAFESHAPDLIGPAEAALALSGEDLGFRRLDRKAFGRCADLPFGKAVMENLDECTALHLACGWADLADWHALKEVCETDGADNLVAGNASAFECTGSILKSADPDTKIVGMGLKDIVAVATDDGILVADLSHSSDVGEMVDTLRAEGAVQADGFRRCYRPWGYYETLSLGERFQVKRIMVEPGAKLSLQSHVHRAEHWVVVSGAARVTVNEDVRLLGENESTYIPLGAVHRLENPGKLPLHLIEVQSGCYLGEDDIVRYEDDYQRDEVL
ncbi:mannose-1-phosphate guanylyltransferase/mannose-6-phosphate isomerase [Shimia sp. R11_0]|uniref:mannose-1-phosphate guanylyltransferase/mannose-6-phosphate isomerase n=1 Tax=Shimia sp. R11_0 TaxID=2821096 RepID=UPI001ADBDAF6|nr:mannose-1-phosphate guanylyltransferase/mannose-6-phosphate isomerase [Shimia sp. R11_0]MBO9476729.1 mannose-1-phosphate guanylyltransferase/mannose-6-phosphate isomerase [Shimia sp. R11_0]